MTRAPRVTMTRASRVFFEVRYDGRIWSDEEIVFLSFFVLG